MSGKVTMCAVGLALAVCDAKAEPVLFQFSGEVTHSIEVPEEGHVLSGAIVVGTTFSGTYTLESTTPDSAPQDAWWGEYYGAIDDLGGAIHGELGNVDFQGPVFLDDLGQESNHVMVRKSWDSAWDHHTFVAGVDVLGLSFEFRWVYHPPYWSNQYPLIDSLPINPPPFEDITITRFSFTELEPAAGEPAYFEGHLTSLSVVPEPTTGMLLLAAGGLLLARRRRRS